MNPSPRFFWLTTPALVATALPAAAQVYLSEAQALATIFGRELTVHREEKRLSPEDRQKLESRAAGLRFPEASYIFFVAQRRDEVAGYAVVLEEIGKSEPITFMVGMTPEGKVSEVVVMAFRESRGWEIREPRFLRQFRGKTAADPIRINQDILNYTGATLSSKAIARGVKRALLLREHFYARETKPQPPRPGALVVPALPTPIAHTDSPRRASLYRQIRGRMGTLAEIRVWADSPRAAAAAFAAGFAELTRLDSIFSNYRDSSELARVNREAVARPVAVSDEFWQLAQYAARQARQSAGSFDITVGPLVKLWGFRQGEPRVPTGQEIEAARTRVGMEKVKLSPRERTLRFLADDMELDFGGLAKGYAAERVARLLARECVRAALVNLGRSSLSTVSRPASTAAERRREMQWIVAAVDPRGPTRPALFFVLEDGWSVSTSGTYEQRWMLEGRTVSHLIDPRTGCPLEGVRSATVIARRGGRSEALSKQLLILTNGARERALRKLRGGDWALLEVSSAGELSIRHRFRHSTVLLPIV